MSFTRVVFIAIFLAPILGLLVGTYVVSAMLGGSAAPAFEPRATLSATATPRASTPAPEPSATHPSREALAKTATPTIIPTPRPRPTQTPLAPARPAPLPSPTAGTITLNSYWIGTTAARPGTTIAFGYVIDNGTGRTAELMLGASIKSSRTATWVNTTISDPRHDVVATVPPGVTTHTRYFTIPSRLRPGYYDVAWGLRDTATGEPVAVVSSIASLRLRR
jgi:hypothetical protein